MFYSVAGLVRRADPFQWVSANDFDPDTLENDLAILFYRNPLTFPFTSVINFADDVALPTANSNGLVAGYGFTSINSEEPNQTPMVAAQTVLAACNEDILIGTATHFCAQDTQSIICPGDNGAGIFIAGATPLENQLVILFENYYSIIIIEFYYKFRLVLYLNCYLVVLPQLKLLTLVLVLS